MGFDPANPSTIRQQINDGVAQFRRDFDRLVGGFPTAGGWNVGISRQTEDGVGVTPTSKTAATLFSYTPLVGVQWGGNTSFGGNFIFCGSWAKFDFSIFPQAVILNQPSDITVSSLRLSWTPSEFREPDFAAYGIFRSTNSPVTENSTPVALITTQFQTEFADSGLSPNTTYFYKVFVRDQDGLFTGSNEVSASTSPFTVSYDFASDFVFINGNINPVPGCTASRVQDVSFFDEFNDGSVSTGCTANFFQDGVFEEANSLLQMKSENGLISGDFVSHFAAFNQFFRDGNGPFDIRVHFRPDPVRPFPNFSLYGIFLRSPFTPLSNLSIQTSPGPNGETFLVAGNNITQQFVGQQINPAALQNLAVRAEFDDDTNIITPLFTLDNGQTFQRWFLPDGSVFSPLFFTADSRAGVALTGQARLPASSSLQAFSSDFSLTPVQVSGTDGTVMLPLLQDFSAPLP